MWALPEVLKVLYPIGLKWAMPINMEVGKFF